MSARAKIRRTALGKRTVDAFYPVVCAPTMLAVARSQAAEKLLELAGPRALTRPEFRVYVGDAKVTEVLETLRVHGAAEADDRYGHLIATAAALGDSAVLVLASCRALA